MPFSFGLPPFVKVFMVIFGLMFVAIAGTIIYTIVRSIATAAHNRQQPLLRRSARIVAKRQETSHHHHHNDTDHLSHGTTWYYVTFEFPDGSREEFSVGGHEYGLLAEGDMGTLHTQGSWFKGFQRFQ